MLLHKAFKKMNSSPAVAIGQLWKKNLGGQCVIITGFKTETNLYGRRTEKAMYMEINHPHHNNEKEWTLADFPEAFDFLIPLELQMACKMLNKDYCPPLK